MNYVVKAKITNPNTQLLESLNRNSNVARFTYNWMLSYCVKNKSKPQEARDVFRRLVKSKSLYNSKNGEIYDDEFQTLLKATPSQITDMESNDLARAFRTVRKTRVPSFKSKYKSKQSFTLNKRISDFKLSEDGYLRIVKTGTIKLNLRKLRFNFSADNIQRVTLSESAYGWYISILIRIPDNSFTLPENINRVGIDWGIKAFSSDSDGVQFRVQDQQWYTRYVKLYKRLKELQSILGKKRHNNKKWKTSNKYKKLKFKIKFLYERLANIRKDFLHEVSKYYVNNYGTINIEDLRPSNMLKNHKLARVIAEGMFYTWKVMLTYKCGWYGRNLNVVNPANTSQTCNKCGMKLEEKLKLSQRTFRCSCGHEDDRDINAAKNILALA